MFGSVKTNTDIKLYNTNMSFNKMNFLEYFLFINRGSNEFDNLYLMFRYVVYDGLFECNDNETEMINKTNHYIIY